MGRIDNNQQTWQTSILRQALQHLVPLEVSSQSETSANTVKKGTKGSEISINRRRREVARNVDIIRKNCV